MSDADRTSQRPDRRREDPGRNDGGVTQPTGTPMAVDVESDPRTRRAMARFVAGPVIWFGHFMVVYLVAEAGCTGGGPGLELFAPPVPTVVTIVATVVAAAACLVLAWAEYRRWRDGREVAARTAGGEPEMADAAPGGPLAFAGVLLALVSFVAVVFVGIPALVLTSC